MVKRIPKTKSLLLLILLMALVVSGCGAKGYQPPAPVRAYNASGMVVDEDGTPLENVTILFSDPFESVNTAADGTWTKSGLYESVTVTPSLVGYEFNPSSQVITKATSGIKFTGTVVPPYDATGQITIGQKPSTTVLDLTTVALNYEYPAGTPRTVYPDAGGNWQIDDITGTVTVTPTLAGWEFVPASFELTEASATVNLTANRVFTGQQILDAIVADTAIRTASAVPMPDTISIDGDDVSLASTLYLIAKWITLYTDGSTSEGATPAGNIPYLEIEEPDAITLGKTDGFIRFGNATAGYYKTAVDLVSVLEDTKKIPDEIIFPEGWNDSGSTGFGTTETIDSPNVINIFALVINFTNTNSNLANTVGYKGVDKPTGTDWASIPEL